MGWLPIETAPKDGTRFLLWMASGDDDGVVKIAAWDTFEKHFVIEGRHHAYKRSTHWMPLPAHPRDGER